MASSRARREAARPTNALAPNRTSGANAPLSPAAALVRSVAIAVLVGAGAVIAAHGRLGSYLATRLEFAPLRYVFALWLVATAAAAALLLAAMTRGRRARRREDRGRALEPEIIDRLARHAALGDQATELRALAERDRTAVARCLAGFMPAIRGYQRERLASLATTLALTAGAPGGRRSRTAAQVDLLNLARLSAGTADPVLFAALVHHREAIRLEAALALIRSGERSGLEAALSFATTQPPIVRALLAEQTRAHLLELDPRAINELLDHGDRGRVVAMLEIIDAWRRAYSLPDFERLLVADDPAVRAHALRVLPLTAADERSLIVVAHAIADPLAEIRAAAIDTAGRMRIDGAAEALAARLRDDHGDRAEQRAAAAALVAIGPAGRLILETAIATEGPGSAIAAEALEMPTPAKPPAEVAPAASTSAARPPAEPAAPSKNDRVSA
jgi:HEAT repeat protein